MTDQQSECLLSPDDLRDLQRQTLLRSDIDPLMMAGAVLMWERQLVGLGAEGVSLGEVCEELLAMESES